MYGEVKPSVRCLERSRDIHTRGGTNRRVSYLIKSPSRASAGGGRISAHHVHTAGDAALFLLSATHKNKENIL